MMVKGKLLCRDRYKKWQADKETMVKGKLV